MVMDSEVQEQVMQNYKKNGYIIVRNFFDTDELDAVKSDAENIFRFQLKNMGLNQLYQV